MSGTSLDHTERGDRTMIRELTSEVLRRYYVLRAIAIGLVIRVLIGGYRKLVAIDTTASSRGTIMSVWRIEAMRGLVPAEFIESHEALRRSAETGWQSTRSLLASSAERSISFRLSPGDARTADTILTSAHGRLDASLREEASDW